MTRLAKDSTIIYSGSMKQYTLIIAVFSACAEMFLWRMLQPLTLQCFLCMRRDVSKKKDALDMLYRFSLHAQRCFSLGRTGRVDEIVFSACAEMFPLSA